MQKSRSISGHLTRRTILRGIAGGLATLTVAPVIATCGGDDEDGPESNEPTAVPEADPVADPEADPEAESTWNVPTGSLVIYSGRSEELVGPIIERFADETGVDVAVRYGGTAELAVTLLEEGKNSPACVFFAQDAGGLGAVANVGMFAELPSEILDRVDVRFRSDENLWVGVSGRARTIIYNRQNVSEEEIPESILNFTADEWRGRLGWAPTNGSFQAFVTALRLIEGEEVAREWLEGIKANDVAEFSGNMPIVQAAINGEIDAGFVNHYYLYRFEEEAGGEVGAANFWYLNGDPGALVNVAGAGILNTCDNVEAAEALLEFFLSEEGQTYFSEETFEYPLVAGIAADPRLVPLDEIVTPDIDLSQLEDLEGTLELLRDVGLI